MEKDKGCRMKKIIYFYIKNFKRLILLQVILCITIAIILSRLPKTEKEIRFDQSCLFGGIISEEGYACFDESDGVYGIVLDIETDEIEKGWYKVQVEYETGYDDNGIIVQALRSGNVLNRDIGKEDRTIALKSQHNSKEIHAWLKEDSALRIGVHFCGGGHLQIKKINLQKNPEYTPVFLIVLCMLFINVEFYEMAFLSKEEIKRRRYIRRGILCIVLLGSIPLLNGYAIGGDDYRFHLFRIEGIAEGLRSGQFPVKIMPNWWNEFGYGTSLFYGDIFLYVPAVLTFFGYSMQTVYKCYVVGINLLTAWIAYKSFYKISKDDRIALIGAFLYSLNLYRLIDIYIRSAVGEYTAIAFLPLVFLGIYFMEEDGWIYLALGLTGCIQSHVLTSMMVVFFAGLFGIIKIRWLLKKTVLLQFCKAGIVTFLWNAWFIIPFLNIYIGQKYKVHFAGHGLDLDKRALPVSAIFQIFFDEYYTLGLPLILAGVVAFVLLLVYRKRLNEKQGNRNLKREIYIFLFMMGIAVSLSLKWIPYNKMKENYPLIGKLMGTVQFPWRFMEFAAVFSVIALVSVYFLWKKSIEVIEGKKIRILWYGTQAVLSVLIILGALSVYDALVPDEGYIEAHEYYALEGFIDTVEYLPADAESGEVSHELLTSSKDITVSDYEKKYTNIKVDCENKGAEDGYIDVPLFYYPCYKAKDERTGEIMPLVYGKNSRVRIILPSGYQGTISLRVSERKLWRITEFISGLSVAVAVYIGVRNKRRINIESL